MSFGEQMRAFSEAANRSTEKVIRGVELRLFKAVILDTPVGNPALWESPAPEGYVGGRLRGNWQTSINAPASGEVDFGGSPPSEAQVIAGLQSFITALRGGQVTFLTNNLPYAEPVEFGHSSQQAPAGMMRKNVARFERLLSNEAKEHQT